jgi:hypothetical protein
MARFFGVASAGEWQTLYPYSRKLWRLGVVSMAMAIGCHVWDQYDRRSDWPVTAEIVDCSVVSKVEQPLVRITVEQRVYLLRPRPGVLDSSKCHAGDRVRLYHPPFAPTKLHRDREAILSLPALLLGVIGFVLLFGAAYVYAWPIWVSGDWKNAPPRIQWLRHVPVQWLSLPLLALAYPLAMWLQR